jgi:hypothetical protein
MEQDSGRLAFSSLRKGSDVRRASGKSPDETWSKGEGDPEGSYNRAI